jgi:hypothetical protein
MVLNARGMAKIPYMLSSATQALDAHGNKNASRSAAFNRSQHEVGAIEGTITLPSYFNNRYLEREFITITSSPLFSHSIDSSELH